jgi:hypothetical protein
MFCGGFESIFETTLVVFYTKIWTFTAGEVAVLQLWERFDLLCLLFICLEGSRVIFLTLSGYDKHTMVLIRLNLIDEIDKCL